MARTKPPFFSEHIFATRDLTSMPDIDPMQATCRLTKPFNKSLEVIIPEILLISDTYDYECDKIAQILLDRGFEYARINSSYLPNKLFVGLSTIDDTPIFQIISGDQTIETTRLKIIVFRNFNITNVTTGLDPVSDAIYKQEWIASMSSILSVSKAILINDLQSDLLLDNPGMQLLLARNTGFKIPRTIITNIFDDIVKFCEDNPSGYLVKSIGLHHVIIDGVRHSFFSKSLATVWTKLENCLSTPLLVQEIVSNSFDLRVTFVKNNLFFTQIIRPDKSENIIDYHRLNLTELTYIEYNPNILFEGLCRRFIEKTGLFYGSLDFVFTDENNFVFLEINTTPDWHWLETAHKTSITKVFVDEVIKQLEYAQ